MRKKLLALGLLATLAAQSPGVAQETIPGGATGSNVYCLQAGDITSGAFVGAFLQTGQNAWEERLRAGVFSLQERRRDDLMVELFDAQRSATIQLDFVNKTVKYKPANSPQPSGTDRYHILNATDQASSGDCAHIAAASGPEGSSGGGGGAPAAAGGAGGAGGRGGAGGAGAPSPQQLAAARSAPGVLAVDFINVPPRVPVNVPPGTQLLATSGPPCPGNPGFFLCPNKFNCAPIGGVCCPGAGTCKPGSFCDRFVVGHCINQSSPRFCPGTGNQRTGISMHCPIGKTCSGNRCV
jgi:hypothetical protein